MKLQSIDKKKLYIIKGTSIVSLDNCLSQSRESDRISYRGRQAAIAQPGHGIEHTQQTVPRCQRKPN